jgi:hypothetical protein
VSGAEVAAAYFVDSSALVKRYVLETGTAWVRGLTRQSSSTVISTSPTSPPLKSLVLSRADEKGKL